VPINRQGTKQFWPPLDPVVAGSGAEAGYMDSAAAAGQHTRAADNPAAQGSPVAEGFVAVDTVEADIAAVAAADTAAVADTVAVPEDIVADPVLRRELLRRLQQK